MDWVRLKGVGLKGGVQVEEVEDIFELDDLVVGIWLDEETMDVEVEVEHGSFDIEMCVEAQGNTVDSILDSAWCKGLIESGRIVDTDGEIKDVDTCGEIKTDGDDRGRRLEQSSTRTSSSL